MQHDYLHVFRLTVEGIAEPIEFRMFHEKEDASEVTDGFAKWVARQEDDFIPLGPTAAIRANRVLRIDHVRAENNTAN